MTARQEGWTVFRGPEDARCVGAHPDMPGRPCHKFLLRLQPGSLAYVRPRIALWPAASGANRPAEGPAATARCWRCATELDVVFTTEPITFPTSSTPIPL